MIKRKNFLILGLISVLSVSIFLLFSYVQDGIGFPLDDAWIHQTYAKNLANGDGWSFVAGQASAGLTAPLWGWILSIGQKLGFGPFIYTFILSWLFLWALSILGSIGLKLIYPGKENWALAAGILIATEWHLIWAAVSGMETLLYALIVLAVLVLLLNKIVANENDYRMIPLGVLVGLSVWIRPEGITLFGPILLVILVWKVPWQKKLIKTIYTFLGFGIIFIPYLYFNRWLAGEWWPNTFYAKQAEYAILKQIPLLSRIVEQFSQPMIGVGILLLPGFIYLFIIAIRKKQWTILATTIWTLGHFILYAVRLPVSYQHGRYGMPAMPVYFLIAFAGILQILNLQPKKLVGRVLIKSLKVTIPVISLIFMWIGGNAYARDVAFINTEMVDVAKWISENIPSEDIVAAHDIGAIGYFSNHQIIDLAGLISPEVIPIMGDEIELEKFLDRKKVDYLITFPSWYPNLVRQSELIYQTDGSVNQFLKRDNMAVYCWECSGPLDIEK